MFQNLSRIFTQQDQFFLKKNYFCLVFLASSCDLLRFVRLPIPCFSRNYISFTHISQKLLKFLQIKMYLKVFLALHLCIHIPPPRSPAIFKRWAASVFHPHSSQRFHKIFTVEVNFRLIDADFYMLLMGSIPLSLKSSSSFKISMMQVT